MRRNFRSKLRPSRFASRSSSSLNVAECRWLIGVVSSVANSLTVSGVESPSATVEAGNVWRSRRTATGRPPRPERNGSEVEAQPLQRAANETSSGDSAANKGCARRPFLFRTTSPSGSNASRQARQAIGAFASLPQKLAAAHIIDRELICDGLP